MRSRSQQSSGSNCATQQKKKKTLHGTHLHKGGVRHGGGDGGGGGLKPRRVQVAQHAEHVHGAGAPEPHAAGLLAGLPLGLPHPRHAQHLQRAPHRSPLFLLCVCVAIAVALRRGVPRPGAHAHRDQRGEGGWEGGEGANTCKAGVCDDLCTSARRVGA